MRRAPRRAGHAGAGGVGGCGGGASTVHIAKEIIGRVLKELARNECMNALLVRELLRLSTQEISAA